jgi:hypothetical protein
MYKNKKYIREFLDKEVFVVSCGEVPFSIYIFEDYEQLSIYVENNYGMYGDVLTIHHGILTQADILSPDDKNQKSFIIVVDFKEEELAGAVIDSESKCINELSNKIEGLSTVGYNYRNDNIKFEDDISNIFILYGYEIGTKTVVDLEDMDEESIDSCKKISNDIILIRKGILNGKI